MNLIRLAGDSCPGDNCPTTYLTDRGTAIVQGPKLLDREALAAIGLPEHESAVEVPLSLLRDTVKEFPAQ